MSIRWTRVRYMNTTPTFEGKDGEDSKILGKDDTMLSTNKFDDTLYKEPYYTLDGCLYEEVIKNGKTFMIKLCDYLPVLRSEITYDDGAERRKVFEVSAEHASGVTLPTVLVSAEDMISMKWLLEKWGALGSYSPTNNAAGHIRHAITMTKADINFRTIYSQTGWREVSGEWFFLMPQEDSPFTVELPGKLRSYHFNKCCSDDDHIYLAAMLDDSFLPQRLMLPLLAVTFVAPLEHFMRLGNCESKFITALVGKTGSRKSSSAAVFLSFFGNFNASNLPNSFHDTANSILSNIYHTKDVLTCVDDLHPNGRYGDAEMKNIAQNLSRYYGDRILDINLSELYNITHRVLWLEIFHSERGDLQCPHTPTFPATNTPNTSMTSPASASLFFLKRPKMLLRVSNVP